MKSKEEVVDVDLRLLSSLVTREEEMVWEADETVRFGVRVMGLRVMREGDLDLGVLDWVEG